MSSQIPTDIVTRIVEGLFIGVILDNFLLGVATVQLYTYWQRYAKDATLVKLLVVACAAPILAAGALNSYTIYLCAVSEFGHLELVITPKQSLNASVLATILPFAFVQVFFAWRVKGLTGRWWVLILVGVLALAEAGLMLTGTIIGISNRTYSQLEGQRSYITISWFCAEIVINVLNSAHLVYFFRTQRTGFWDTDDLLNRLAAVTVTTGLAVAVWSLATLCTVLAGTSTALAVILLGPPIYLITLLSTLNSRYCRSDIRWSDNNPRFSSSSAVRGSDLLPVEVHINQTIEMEGYEFQQRNSTRETRVIGTSTHVISTVDRRHDFDLDDQSTKNSVTRQHDSSLD